MGYDVTFHPVSLEDIRRYVFDVVENPELAPERSASLAGDADTHRHVENIYKEISDWANDLTIGKPLALRSTFAYATARLAGFIHPYWYVRNAQISALGDEAILALFVPLDQLPGAPDLFRKMDTGSHIVENYSASGVIIDVAELERGLERLGLDESNGAPLLFSAFDETRLAALREAIAYCKKNQLALIEAADAVVPAAGDAFTHPDNLREAERFDEPSSQERRWYEAPRRKVKTAFERYTDSTRPNLNDIVVVRRLLGRNRIGTFVPSYLVGNHDHRKQPFPRYTGVLFDDGSLETVKRSRITLLRRAETHRAHWRRLLDHERRYFEEDSQTHPGPHIQEAQHGIGDIPERELTTGLEIAFAEDWQLADAYFGKTLVACELIIRDKHAERDMFSYPGNLAKVLRTQVLAQALLDDTWDLNRLQQACDRHIDYAEGLERSRWDDYRQRDYVEFALTSLLAERPDQTLAMLNVKRPFGEQTELIALYRLIAQAQSVGDRSEGLLEKCMSLLQVIRHPNSLEYLLRGATTGLQLAIVADRSLVSAADRKSVRDIVSWLGR